MDFKDLKEYSEKDLHQLLNEQRERLQQLRFKAGQSQVTNIRELRQVKKTIAKILTKLKMNQAAASQKSTQAETERETKQAKA
ncbi:MAG: 50S ribosomal protein L29 [Candidatus Buchananbacteria bacterium CG10_big_fil_rev_8_21_14_0_10_42_9]|uniref:Large ribosomal subunit protein uL29 n=1 Tax=Candidatus Buchananbacteria bacterium CG10_big_fil_rev_8_21_14_0_10_42_9 TaxID=1974526 RepID=A0A2H0W430_9BACT|nr:MAG: 50S ribosomal protein L29 [Candidatus Buchananbacteria bacterium CG10_big_fil_rev_8_21_14_0_10_42_9]